MQKLGRADKTVRDNYVSRDARPDVYYARVKVGPVVAEGGRMLQSLPLTEMIWDADLRPFGGTVALDFSRQGSLSHLAVRGLYAKGSHWFDDESVMFGGSMPSSIMGTITTCSGGTSRTPRVIVSTPAGTRAPSVPMRNRS